MNAFRAITLTACAIGCGMAMASAEAADVIRVETVPAVAACKPATAAYRDQLRFRPIGAQNESDRNAFVSCAFEHTELANVDKSPGGVILRNDSATAQTVTCKYATTQTLIAGPYWTHTFTLPANTAGIEKELYTAHAGYFVQARAVSCMLPPGTGISAIWRQYRDYVGQ